MAGGLSRDAAEEAAHLLLAARGDFRLLDGLPENLRPATVDDGYAIQDAFARLWGLPVAGWKIGCTSVEAQELLAADEPFGGRIFAPFLLDGPAELSAGAFHRPGLEAEFAVRLADDLPGREGGYDRDSVAAAVASLHPAIEIVDSRYSDWMSRGVPSLVADNGVNGGLVLGGGVTEWQEIDLAAQGVRLSINGETVGRGVGGLVLGHPLAALAWLADDRVRRGDPLRAGQVVATGTCTGIHFAGPGDAVDADFGGLGKVALRFAP